MTHIFWSCKNISLLLSFILYSFSWMSYDSICHKVGVSIRRYCYWCSMNKLQTPTRTDIPCISNIDLCRSWCAAGLYKTGLTDDTNKRLVMAHIGDIARNFILSRHGSLVVLVLIPLTAFLHCHWPIISIFHRFIFGSPFERQSNHWNALSLV